MKKIFLLFCSAAFVFTSLSAQLSFDSSKIRCTYSLVYYPDSTNLQDRHEEKMLLFVSDTSSLFESEGEWLNDSSNGKDYTLSNFNFRIFKKGCSHIQDMENIEGDFFVYSEPKKIVWNITEETAKINEYNCQKAVCKLGGREWVAWFTTDIPVSDGPYKFCGLPGLIVKIGDTQNYFNFSLLSIENRKEKISIYNDGNSDSPLLETTKAKYFKVLNAYRHDPMSFVKRHVTITSGEDKIAQNVKRHIEKNNNPIERSVY